MQKAKEILSWNVPGGVILECHLKKESVPSQWWSENCAVFEVLNTSQTKIDSLGELLRGPPIGGMP